MNISDFKRVILCFLLCSSALLAGDIKEIADKCADCHGKDGVSNDSDIPTLAGQSAILIEDALLAFSENERPCESSAYRHGDTSRPEATMCKISSYLTVDQMIEIGEYYSALPFKAAKQEFDASLVERGAIVHERNCEKCHSEGGSYADDDAGILAGQWTIYLKKSIKDFLSKERPMADKMSIKLNRLKPEDFEALFSYYASQFEPK